MDRSLQHIAYRLLAPSLRTEGRYFIQDLSKYNGDFLLWWAEENNGYTTDLCQARRFTEENADRIVAKSDGRFSKWSCDVVLDGAVLAYSVE